MDRTLISWSVPNMITIWLMFFIGFLALGLVTQLVSKRGSSSNVGPADNSTGY